MQKFSHVRNMGGNARLPALLSSVRLFISVLDNH